MDAIELAQKIKKEGRRRQLQLIGKMLRQRDVDPIRQALDKHYPGGFPAKRDGGLEGVLHQ